MARYTRKTNARKTTAVEGGEQLSWFDMSPADFSATVKPVQGSLFPEPDGFGTLDLFDTLGE